MARLEGLKLPTYRFEVSGFTLFNHLQTITADYPPLQTPLLYCLI